MSTRVLSTDQGKASIGTMQRILAGGLSDQIRALDAEGQMLSDANVWDGSLAENFRSNLWPSTSAALKAAAGELVQLRGQVQGINSDIMAAGGNSY